MRVLRRAGGRSRCFSHVSHCNSRLLLRLPPCPVIDLSSETPDWKAVFEQHQPLILKGLARSWKATSSWDSPGYLASQFGEVVVPVEVGGDYMSKKTKHIRVPFAKAVDKLKSLEQKSKNKFTNKTHYYVAQHSLQAFPNIMSDLKIPDLCSSTGRGGVQRSALWFGSAFSSSPCHHDPYHNVLVQIFGSKSICLFSPEVSTYLYPCLPPQQNTSSIDFYKLQYLKNEIEHGIELRLPTKAISFEEYSHPLLASIPLHQAFHAELQKGDGIYIPFKWWHFCKATSTNCSVNFWWL